MNKVELMGRLTKDVERVQTKTNTPMARFTIAVPRKTKDETDFIDCVLFGKLVDVFEKYVQKGNRVIVCGSINTNTYQDKDGNNKKSINIIVDDFYFVEFKKEVNEQIEKPNM